MTRRRDALPRLGFQVQARQCATCIYRPDSPLDLVALEAAVADGHGGFAKHRACHHANAGICCRGFWDRHKDEFPGGQIAQSLGMVQFVDVDTLKTTRPKRPAPPAQATQKRRSTPLAPIRAPRRPRR